MHKNRQVSVSLLCLSNLTKTCYRHCSMSDSRVNRKIEEERSRIGKDALERTHRFDSFSVAHRRRPTPPLSRSSWWLAPPSPSHYTPASAFGHATPPRVGAALVPFPRPARVLADGTLKPRHLSMGSLRPPVRCPRLGTLPQPGCTGAWVLVIGSSRGGRGRRRR
jgi:hypothetical protein